MVLRHLSKLKVDIALLQETHLSAADFPRMKKFWVGCVYGSPAVGRHAGVVIFIKKNLAFTFQDLLTDSEGRRLSLHFQLYETDYVLYNVYAPNSPISVCFQDLANLINKQFCPSIVVGGDMNLVVSEVEDRL